MSQADWMDRLSESLRQHETERQTTFTSLGRYRLMEELGRGGMGVVYHAFDPQLGREVALKVLLDQGFASAEARERFMREAHVAARLSHPNIIPVFDTGEHEGRVFLAMQFIEGTPLDRARLGPRETVAAVRDAARAVQAAHEEGIIHRDLKPANLMIDRGGRAYVTDFGLARRVESGASLTLSGTVVGTPAYMPPEQACGKAADARSDVYALGATLYEGLAGKPPFSGATPLETLKAVTLDEPVAPRRHNPQISKGLEAVILKAMDKRPEGRYASAGDFADDLDRWLAGEEVRAPVRGTLYRLRKKAVRHRWRVISAVSTLALLGAGLVVVGMYVRAVQAYRAAMAETDRDRKKDLLEVAAPFISEARRERERMSREEVPPTPSPAVKPDPVPQRILELVAKIHPLLEAGRLEDARQEIRTLEAVGHAVAEAQAKDLLQRLTSLEFQAGVDKLGAVSEPAEFAALFEKLRRPEYRGREGADLKLAGHALSLGLRLAKGPDRKAAVYWLSQAESHGSRKAELFEARGLARIGLGDWKGAREDHDAFLKWRLGDRPPDPGFSSLFRHHAAEAASRRAWKDSLALLETAIKIHPRDARALHDHGLSRFHVHGQTREALQDLRRALELDPRLEPSRDYLEIAWMAASRQGTAWSQENAADRRSAWKEAEEDLDLALGRIAPGHPELLLERARVRRRLGDLPGSIQDATNAGDRAEAFLEKGVALYPSDLEGAAASFAQAGDPARARYWRGVCLHALGLSAEAKEELLAAIRLGFDGPDVHARLAAIALDLRAWEDVPGRAARVHETAADVGEDEIFARERTCSSRGAVIRLLRRDAHYLTARARFELKDYRRSIDECDLAFLQDPGFPEAHFRKGYALFSLRRHEEAIQSFTRAIVPGRREAAPYVGRATTLAELRRFAEAVSDYTRALEIDPGNHAALAGRGLARAELGLAPEAREDLHRALERAPKGWAHQDRILKRLAELR